jgi:hypothetical protein
MSIAFAIRFDAIWGLLAFAVLAIWSYQLMRGVQEYLNQRDEQQLPRWILHCATLGLIVLFLILLALLSSLSQHWLFGFLFKDILFFIN